MHTGTASQKVTTAVLIALMALSCAPITINASVHSKSSDSLRNRFESASDLVDLDGDSKAHRRRLRSNGSNEIIDISFAGPRISRLTFTTDNDDHRRLICRDIDADDDLDLVWIGDRQQTTTVVFINDGNGVFTEAKDNAPYAAELDALLNSSDPSEQPSIQAENQTYTLTSSPSPDIAPAVASRLTYPTDSPASSCWLERFANQPAFLSDLPKRGPPITAS